MKVPALLFIVFLLLTQVFVAGTPFIGSSDNVQKRTCCTPLNPCPMKGESEKSGTGHCNCNFPKNNMVPCSCGCSNFRMTAPVQSLSDRLRQYIIRGYRRISRKNVLDHESRRLLFTVICQNPGQDLRSLAKICDLNEHTLKYHLDRIIGSGYVSVHISGGIRHYFENHGTYSVSQQVLLSRLNEGGAGRILALVRDNPGLSRGEIAIQLGVSGPVISRSMQTLVEEGLIRQVTDGKFRRYYPGWDYT